ncbi:MAG: transporter related protein [Bacteroidetes bacterium]|jgi:lipoprotein-releasing system ATP-binding protein|nr:transporter related protein [Bacteroidota bacterium]
MSDQQPIITATAITKTFLTGDAHGSTLRVLRGISLTIMPGEIIAVVGASGAGKSTLLHILGTLDRPTSGEVMYDSTFVFALDDEALARFRNRSIGFVFQFHHLLPEFSAIENVAMPALINGEKLAKVRERALSLLDEVGVGNRAEARPSQLSGGEQQRVAVARALMNKPRVILADEPSGNLDSANADLLHRLIWDLSRKMGQTFVVVTHNETLARRADRIIRIVDGIIEIV